MEKTFFVAQINRLKNCYGEKSYSNERVELIWKWAKDLSNQKFSLIVDSAINECERAPLLSKLKEFSITSHRSKEKIFCPYCNGEGWYIPKNSAALPTAYACRCEAGEALPSYVQRFSGELERYVPTAGELAWRNTASQVLEKISKAVDKP